VAIYINPNKPSTRRVFWYNNQKFVHIPKKRRKLKTGKNLIYILAILILLAILLIPSKPANLQNQPTVSPSPTMIPGPPLNPTYQPPAIHLVWPGSMVITPPPGN